MNAVAEAKWAEWRQERTRRLVDAGVIPQMHTIKVSAEAVADHISRLYGAECNQQCCANHSPMVHVDGISNGYIRSVEFGKRIATVTLSDAAIKEMLSDFDYYTSLLNMRGVIENDTRGLAQVMKRAAASIRNQTNQ